MLDKILRLNLILIFSLVLNACGGGGGGSDDDDGDDNSRPPAGSANNSENTGADICLASDTVSLPSIPNSLRGGFFTPPRVINIDYMTPTQSGVTNGDAVYNYLFDEAVQFSIGDLDFPETNARFITSLLNFAETRDPSNNIVLNMARLLMALDQDQDTTTGVFITDTAKASATPFSFDQSIDDFGSDPAVLNLIMNGGQDVAVTELPSEAQALFWVTAIFDAVEFPPYGEIIGTWYTQSTENDFLAFTFFDNGIYAHAEVDFDHPFETSGLEVGRYSRDEMSGELTIEEIIFNENNDIGLSDLGSARIYANVSQNILNLTIDEDNNGSIDESIEFEREQNGGLLGTWRNLDDFADLRYVSFINETEYLLVNYDPNNPNGFIGGMEWGNYTYDSDTHRLITSVLFNSDEEFGLSPFQNAVRPPALTISVVFDRLVTETFSCDGMSTGTIEYIQYY